MQSDDRASWRLSGWWNRNYLKRQKFAPNFRLTPLILDQHFLKFDRYISFRQTY
ncbi:hypothetical protein [[Phormidium ambiguum] IAM M-71]|uniref:hypothetical protein n=1 Tax=[Phormidium ambiguum] IAM M-71 TaxID=454136 RepID=UPI0015C04670|nr:hypothetical protein [Phormidium ambiguum]